MTYITATIRRVQQYFSILLRSISITHTSIMIILVDYVKTHSLGFRE